MTRAPLVAAAAPIVAPILPGCSSAIVLKLMICSSYGGIPVRRLVDSCSWSQEQSTSPDSHRRLGSEPLRLRAMGLYLEGGQQAYVKARTADKKGELGAKHHRSQSGCTLLCPRGSEAYSSA